MHPATFRTLKNATLLMGSRIRLIKRRYEFFHHHMRRTCQKSEAENGKKFCRAKKMSIRSAKEVESQSRNGPREGCANGIDCVFGPTGHSVPIAWPSGPGTRATHAPKAQRAGHLIRSGTIGELSARWAWMIAGRMLNSLGRWPRLCELLALWAETIRPELDTRRETFAAGLRESG